MSSQAPQLPPLEQSLKYIAWNIKECTESLKETVVVLREIRDRLESPKADVKNEFPF